MRYPEVVPVVSRQWTLGGLSGQVAPPKRVRRRPVYDNGFTWVMRVGELLIPVTQATRKAHPSADIYLGPVSRPETGK
jgi:hypothetical protein